ncbi:MAG: hypothetical protein ACU0DT_15845 [Albimonas sp.]|uniref:hypothetical protein n=1 Tax=Albimonas sp. TaxID=1872425 RepID=UPI0040569357
MTAKASVTQAELTRALKAAAAADLQVARFEVLRSGRVVVYTVDGAPSAKAPNDFDSDDE